MTDKRKIEFLSPDQCRAARALLNWTQAELASFAGVSRSTVRGFEGEHHELHRTTELKFLDAFEKAGVLLIPPQNNGPGVRLRKTY